ncbi:MAG: amino acid adenylation domain-containing protein [Lachnospiraceae bacterium]|nr:amino acid adenylation domain-containing protein [Lachnospiraceae bacterium]
MYNNILDLLENSCRKFPDKEAFGDVEKDITFQNLVQTAKVVGTLLADKIKIAEPVAFYMDKSVSAVCGMFGTVYAGGFYSFLDVKQPQARTESVLHILEPKVIFTDEENLAKISGYDTDAEIILLEKALEGDIDEEKLTVVRKNFQDVNPLYVNFTSGSTGVPKGVVVSHRSVIEFISYFTEIFDIKSEDIIGNQAPFDFDVSVKDIYSGLMTGAKVQLIPKKYFSAPTLLMDYLADKEVTTLVWAVSAMCFVSVMKGFDYRLPEKIHTVMFSGEVLPIKHLKIWKSFLPNAKYVNLYGPTEITCNCTYYILDRDFEDTEVIPMGKAFPNEKVFLLDENDALVTEPNVQGEICVGGTALALGYYKEREKTDQVFVQNPLNKAYNEMIYRTGDLGKYNEDGDLVYVSRKDFQIKHMGHRIELGEIEAVTMAKEGVTRACCIYDHEKQRLILFYTGDREKMALMKELRQALPPFMIPNSLVPVEEMPLNKNGKIDRKKLMEDFQNSK